MLMSATTSEDVKRLQALVLHNPVSLNLLDAGKGKGVCSVNRALLWIFPVSIAIQQTLGMAALCVAID